jgi:anti-sigma factor RsiW
MDCQEVRTTILESFEEPLPPRRISEVDSHLGGCPDCARFAAVQQTLDRRLSIILRPPDMSLEFRSRMRQNIRRDTRQLWSPALPDVVHFLACGTATMLCAVLLPFQATLTLGVGAAVTSVTYLLVTAVRDALERPDEST